MRKRKIGYSNIRLALFLLWSGYPLQKKGAHVFRCLTWTFDVSKLADDDSRVANDSTCYSTCHVEFIFWFFHSLMGLVRPLCFCVAFMWIWKLKCKNKQGNDVSFFEVLWEIKVWRISLVGKGCANYLFISYKV